VSLYFCDTEWYSERVRKLRAASEGRGKRGSARVVYLYIELRETTYLLLAYPKNAQVNRTDEQKRRLRALVVRLRQER
jgi:hypothetical protein